MPSAAFFTLNRDGIGPAYQWASNRTPAPFRYNDWFISIFITTGCLLLVLLVLLPTLKRKWKTFCLVVLSLCMGTAVVLCCVLPEWQNGYAYILDPLKVEETDYLPLWLGLHVGLLSTNITLTLAAHPPINLASNHSESWNSTDHQTIPLAISEGVTTQKDFYSTSVTLPLLTVSSSLFTTKGTSVDIKLNNGKNNHTDKEMETSTKPSTVVWNSSLLEVGTEIDLGEGLGTSIRTQPILPRLLPRPKRAGWGDNDWGDTAWRWWKDSITAQLNTTNITLPYLDINFNEQVYWRKAPGMQEQYVEGLERGLPVSILTMLDYLQHQDGGLRWSDDFRVAGYFSYFLIVVNLALWSCMNILFLVLPRYGAITMACMGLTLLLTNLVYYVLLPVNELVVHISNTTLTLQLGWCYWTTFGTGIIALWMGTLMLYYDVKIPGSVTTDLELDSEWRKLLEEHQLKAVQRKVHPTISVTDGTAWQTMTPDEKLRAEKRKGYRVKQAIIIKSHGDSGVSSTAGSRTFLEEIEMIATDDGSFWKQNTPDLELNVIKTQLQTTVRLNDSDSHLEEHSGLPCFEESMIHGYPEQHFLESIVEEQEAFVARSATKRPADQAPAIELIDLIRKQYQEKDQFVKDDDEGEKDRYESSSNSSTASTRSNTSSLWGEEEMPENMNRSTTSLPIPTAGEKEPTPRRRTQRHQSVG